MERRAILQNINLRGSRIISGEATEDMAEKSYAENDHVMNGRQSSNEPNWLTGYMGDYPEQPAPLLFTAASEGFPSEPQVPEPIQQSDLMKPLLMDIANHGLKYAYDKYKHKKIPDDYLYMHNRATVMQPPKQKMPVIIVGAGMAGLVAAYELKRVGYEVKIVEMQDRVGGRVKTFGEKQGFDPGLYVDGKLIATNMSVATCTS